MSNAHVHVHVKLLVLKYNVHVRVYMHMDVHNILHVCILYTCITYCHKKNGVPKNSVFYIHAIQSITS